jgi:hypothetical protein
MQKNAPWVPKFARIEMLQTCDLFAYPTSFAIAKLQNNAHLERLFATYGFTYMSVGNHNVPPMLSDATSPLVPPYGTEVVFPSD